MDRDGLACVRSNLHLRDEGGLLDGNLGILEMVVVEPDLADGEAARIGCEFGELCQASGVARCASCG